ncbi:MAG: hypothetical protein HYU64_21985 [Armatimonadetes bacterium]|nr:hypothetical protein [Armatimonadota bacterium]
MRDLSLLRENWDEIKKIETQLLRKMTIFESVEELEALYLEFRHELEITEPLYRDERVRYLCELQERLGTLRCKRPGEIA